MSKRPYSAVSDDLVPRESSAPESPLVPLGLLGAAPFIFFFLFPV